MRDQQVCPSGMLTMEFLSLPPEMREEAAAFIEEMRAWSIEIVRRGRQAGVFDFPGEDAAMGALLFSALQGGLQLARVDPGWLETIKRQMRALMGVQQLSNQRSADATV
jgi:TetR/AcrR family transcriptional repressor of nem operon